MAHKRGRGIEAMKVYVRCRVYASGNSCAAGNGVDDDQDS